MKFLKIRCNRLRRSRILWIFRKHLARDGRLQADVRGCRVTKRKDMNKTLIQRSLSLPVAASSRLYDVVKAGHLAIDDREIKIDACFDEARRHDAANLSSREARPDFSQHTATVSWIEVRREVIPSFLGQKVIHLSCPALAIHDDQHLTVLLETVCQHDRRGLPGVLHDADTPEDYRALLKYHNEQLVRPVLSVSLAREKVFFDSRAAMLLQLIDETQSVRSACQRMQMSYSGGWNVIRRLESQLSRTLIRRSQGGAGGGKSSLTEDGKLLLERYTAYSDALRDQAGSLFDRYFEGLF